MSDEILQPIPPGEAVSPERTLESVVDREFLKMLAESSSGFYPVENPTAPTAFTEMKTKRIHIPSFMIHGNEQMGIKPLRNLRGILYHEIGHHVPEVLPFQDRIISDLKSIEIPDAYRGSESSEQRLLDAVWKNAGNAAADIWLESYLSRSPYFMIRHEILGAGKQIVEGVSREHFGRMSKPTALIQAVLASRDAGSVNFEEMLPPDVYEEFKAIVGRKRRNELSPLEILMNTRAHEGFPTPYGKERAVEQKFQVYKEVLLPAYMRLLANEIEERKQQRGAGQKSDQKQGEGQEAGEGKGGKGSGLLEKLRKGMKPQRIDEGAPLTREEEEIIKEIIEELEKEARGHIMALSDEDKEREKQAQRNIGQGVRERREREKRKGQGKEEGKEGKPKESNEPHGLEAIERLNRELERKSIENRQRGLAAEHQVRQETIETWEKIKTEHEAEIEGLAGTLAEIFLEDRRKRIEFLKREGEIVPGLETETIVAILSGDLDPDTKMREIQNPKFLETEIEFIVDTSGSMGGAPIEESVALEVIVTEAFKRIQETLDDEQLLVEEELPFRIGLTKFSVGAERVAKLEEPLNDHKELVMIERSAEIGGGTDETQAVETVYQEMKLGTPNVIKMIILLTDGYGNQQAVAPIMQQIEADDEVIFLAVGLGNNSANVIKSYVEPLQNGENSNIFGIEATTPREIIPGVLDFLRREVEKKRMVL